MQNMKIYYTCNSKRALYDTLVMSRAHCKRKNHYRLVLGNWRDAVGEMKGCLGKCWGNDWWLLGNWMPLCWGNDYLILSFGEMTTSVLGKWMLNILCWGNDALPSDRICGQLYVDRMHPKQFCAWPFSLRVVHIYLIWSLSHVARDHCTVTNWK